MKKLLLTLAMAFGAINSGFAADLYVNNSGQSGTYTTIQAAINAASTGDNIYVSPLNSYQETLSITKSIRIASSVSGSRIIVTGGIGISRLAGIHVVIIGVEGTNIYAAGTSTLGPSSRGLATLSDCSFHDVIFDSDYFTVNAVKLDLSGTITIRHGKIIGCTIDENIQVNDEPNVGIGDTISIKANEVNRIISNNNDHSIIIQNNYIFDGIKLANLRSSSLINILVNNNTLINNRRSTELSNSSNQNVLSTCGAINFDFDVMSQDISYCQVINNLILSDYFDVPSNSETYYISFLSFSGNSFTAGPLIQYNTWLHNGPKGSQRTSSYSYTPKQNFYAYASYNGNTISLQTIDKKGIYNLDFDINQSISNLSTSKLKQYVEDIGSPSPKFFDTDLTRSDIGHLGGDNSWEMFHGTNSVSGAAYIIGLDLPSEIWPGQTVNLKAEAVHTN